MILKTDQTGELWGDAHTYAQPRRMGCGEDPRISGEQSGIGVRHREPAGTVWLDSGHAGGARVLSAEQERARVDPGVSAQGEPVQLGASDALDPAVPPRGRDPEPAPEPAPFSHPVHGGRCGAAGRNGPATSASERTGHEVPVPTRLEAVWRGPVQAAGADLGVALVQPQ